MLCSTKFIILTDITSDFAIYTVYQIYMDISYFLRFMVDRHYELLNSHKFVLEVVWFIISKI